MAWPYTIAGSSDSLSVTRSYEAHRDLLTTVDNTVDTTRISRYSYDNNAIGQRIHALNEGLAFAEAGDAMNLYDYNERGEVIEAERRWGNNPQSPGTSVAGQSFEGRIPFLHPRGHVFTINT